MAKKVYYVYYFREAYQVYIGMTSSLGKICFYENHTGAHKSIEALYLDGKKINIIRQINKDSTRLLHYTDIMDGVYDSQISEEHKEMFMIFKKYLMYSDLPK